MKTLGVFFGLLFSASITYAHSPLLSSIPESGASLTGTPLNLSLKFKNPVRVTKITLTHLQNDIRHSDKLQIPTKKFAKDIILAPRFRGPGTYNVEWRALGQDGHALKGKYSFTVIDN